MNAKKFLRLLVCILCGTAHVARGAEAVDFVQPINWSKYKGMFGVQPDDTFGERLVRLLQNESRYEIRWVKSQYPVQTKAPKFLGTPYYDPCGDSNSARHGKSIRALASFAYGTAVLLATDVYSDKTAGGVTADEALNQAELAIRGVAFAHRANKTTAPQFGGRGTTSETWQAAHWATQAARAAWLLWERLTPETRAAVANMMVDEADSFIDYTVPYWKNPDGTTNFTGDTKAEENAWNAQLPALAQAMMPQHPNVEAWRRKASELQVSAYSRPSDVTSNALVDGKPVKDWLKGYNAFEDGVVVNHNRVHPDYMLCTNTLTSSVIYESLAGQSIPQSAVFNVKHVYHALTEIKFVPGPDIAYETEKSIRPPGGTIYKRTTAGGYDAKVYYPQGNDWTAEVTDGYLNVDLVVEWLGLDAGKDFDAMGWAAARVDAFIALQNRPGHDGNVYQRGDWFTDGRGQDEDLYRSNAAAWLQWWLMRHGQISPIADHWGPLPATRPVLSH